MFYYTLEWNVNKKFMRIFFPKNLLIFFEIFFNGQTFKEKNDIFKTKFKRDFFFVKKYFY
jgi:hypothetical protein